MLVHLSTHFSKYFNLFSIFLLCWYIFTIFDIFRHFSIYFLSFLRENGKGKERAATVESVTSHASIRQKPWRAFGG